MCDSLLFSIAKSRSSSSEASPPVTPDKVTGTSPPSKYKLTPTAEAQAYADSRKISYEAFEMSFDNKRRSRDIGKS